MGLEWQLVCAVAVLLGALGTWVWRGGRLSRVEACGIGLVGLGGLAALGYGYSVHRRDADARAGFARMIPREAASGGYVSSDQCRSCHVEQHQSWFESYHRTMTQVASGSTVLAEFRGELQHEGRTYRLERVGDEFWVEMPNPARAAGRDAQGRLIPPSADGPERVRRRIGLLTGSHHMQVYWLAGERDTLQTLFPFSWLIADRRWAPVESTFLRDPKLGGYTHLWNMNCLKCHATGGRPRPDSTTRTMETEAGELGIACEACHGPGEQHVSAMRNPLTRYLAHWGVGGSGRGERLVNPAKLPKAESAQVCGQCHGIKWIPAAENQRFQQSGFSYRPGEDLEKTTPIVRPGRLDLQEWLREPLKQNPKFVEEHYWNDGEVRVAGREFNGLVESPCFERGEMTCLSCHSSHRSDPNDQLAARREGNEACLQCHTGMRDRVEAHTRHKPGSSGSLCYNCHMPHTTYGLLKGIRSHRVTSPSVRATLETGRPNACNLCHLDRTLEWTATELEKRKPGVKVEVPEEHRTTAASVVWTLKGDAGQRALMAWHMGWGAAREASGDRWLGLYLGHMLDDPYAAVRYIAQRSLRSVPGFEGLSYDYVGSAESRREARAGVIREWSARTSSGGGWTNARVLLGENGKLDGDRFLKLARSRDNRSMDLQE